MHAYTLFRGRTIEILVNEISVIQYEKMALFRGVGAIGVFVRRG